MKTKFRFGNLKTKTMSLYLEKNAHFSHFLWNLKFKFFSKINYFIFGLITFLAILFSFLAAHAISKGTEAEFTIKEAEKLVTFSIYIIFLIFLAILFLIISTSSHTSEEKNSRAMEIILSSIGVKFHWFVKLLTNFFWFISIFLWMIIIGSISSSIAGLISFGHLENGSMIIAWILGFVDNCKWLVNHNQSITFSYFWNHSQMSHSYDFFVSMIFITIMINGIIYSIITLGLSSFIVNSGESLMVVLVILLFPIIFSILLGLVVNNHEFLNSFLCYFPLTSIYNVPIILFENSFNTVQNKFTPDSIVWSSVLVNILYIFLFNYFFSYIYAVGVLNYSSNTKIIKRIFSLKKKKK